MDPMQVTAGDLGFCVENLGATVEQLKKLGVAFRSEPIDIPYGPYQGGRSVYFRDPNGVNLQLMQLAGRPAKVSLPAEATKQTS
jgi:predicted enzyme related to lactoylglutathione lyase